MVEKSSVSFKCLQIFFILSVFPIPLLLAKKNFNEVFFINKISLINTAVQHNPLQKEWRRIKDRSSVLFIF